MLFLLTGCGGDHGLPVSSAETPVILISIDTLRSDRLPAYGYEAIETPAIDAFRRDSILYEHAYTHYPLTLPAHGSILTGRLPADHGLRDNVGFTLAAGVPTLAELLGGNGYDTGAVVSSFALRKESGIARGFDLYDDDFDELGSMETMGMIQRPGDASAKIATEWIDRRNGPFFLFLHFYEPHTPYSPPEPWRSRYDDPYDGEIAYVDSIVGGFLDQLKSRGIYDEALIVLLSDHGEGLGDHGEEEHGLFLYREAIQVPLMVKMPRGHLAGETVSEPVQLVDVVPTILDRTGTNSSEQLPGQSLIRFVDEKTIEPRRIYSETWYPRFHYGWSDLHSIVAGELHFIQAPRPEIYDLRADPDESRNILESRRRDYAALRSAVEPLIREPAEQSEIDPEEAAKLAALGYLGSTVRTAGGETLPDPKDRIDSFRDIQRAFRLAREKKYEDAHRLASMILEENPNMVELWDVELKVLNGLGRIKEAIEAGKSALRASPHATHIALQVATLQLDAGELDEARRHAELALEAHPGQAHRILTLIALEQGDLAAAEQYAAEAVEHDRHPVAAQLVMARVKRDQGHLEEALSILEKLRTHVDTEPVADFHFIWGDVLARLGRFREAEEHFREEIRLFPDHPQTYKNYMLLLVSEGRNEEARQLVFDLIQAAPTARSYLAISEALQVLGDRRGATYWAREGLKRFPGDERLERLAS